MDSDWWWLIVPGSYIVISTFFLCFPTLLHARKTYRYEPFNLLLTSQLLFCIGHRGGAFEGPENTLELFRSTAKVCHLFQLDICITKDGQLVVHHDTSLRRTCGMEKEIASLEYRDLPTFMDQYEPFGGTEPIKTQKNRIPLLEQLFQEFPETPMNIDLKTPTEAAIAEFDRLVRKYGRESLTIWGSMGGEANSRLRERNPQVINFYSPLEMLKVTLLCMFGLLPFVCLREGAVEIPLVTTELKRMVSKMDGCFKKCLIVSILHFFNFMSRLFIPHLKKRGIVTFYWIINEEEEFETAISMGCAGIMSDSPSKLARFLKSTHRYFEGSSNSF